MSFGGLLPHQSSWGSVGSLNITRHLQFEAPEPDPQLHVFVSAFPVVNWQVVMDHRPDHDTMTIIFVGFNFHNLPKMQSPRNFH